MPLCTATAARCCGGSRTRTSSSSQHHPGVTHRGKQNTQAIVVQHQDGREHQDVRLLPVVGTKNLTLCGAERESRHRECHNFGTNLKPGPHRETCVSATQSTPHHTAEAVGAMRHARHGYEEGALEHPHVPQGGHLHRQRRVCVACVSQSSPRAPNGKPRVAHKHTLNSIANATAPIEDASFS